MSAVQTNYDERHGVALLGAIADTRFKSVRSFTYEGSENIGFGVALGYGANDNGADLDGTGFAGIVVASQVTDPNNATDAFASGETVGLMDVGAIWVAPTVTVAPGDPVHFVAATGALSNTGGTVIPDAVFETSAAAGELARLRLK